jgi:hypothetical protein
MADYLDMMRGFTQFMDEIERKMYQAEKSVQLPDEIDLYNFFETWGGMAICLLRNWHTAMYGVSCVRTYKTLINYLLMYDDCSQIKYYIGKNIYYAINFNGRGVFLVSEKRYNELKAKKG